MILKELKVGEKFIAAPVPKDNRDGAIPGGPIKAYQTLMKVQVPGGMLLKGREWVVNLINGRVYSAFSDMEVARIV